MIPRQLQKEPGYFQDTIRTPGRAWIDAHPGNRNYPGLWVKCAGDLAEAFDCLCAYSGLFCEEDGAAVDHFLAKDMYPDKVYEWSNFRHAAYKINSRKWKNPTLDPFEIGPGWFAILLPDLRAEVTPACPVERRDQANEFLDKLKLRCGRPALHQRRRWLTRHFMKYHPDFSFLRMMAPMLATSLEAANPFLVDEMKSRYSQGFKC